MEVEAVKKQLEDKGRGAKILQLPCPVLENEPANENWFKRFNPILSQLVNEIQRGRKR